MFLRMSEGAITLKDENVAAISQSRVRNLLRRNSRLQVYFRGSGHECLHTTRHENEPRVGQDAILSHSYFRNSYPCGKNGEDGWVA